MTPERWKQIEELFHEASDLDEPARSKLLKQRTKGDKELLAEVKKLLSQFEQASSFIEHPLYDSDRNGVLSALLDDSDDDPMIGKVLGSYRIEREIGRGGMGAVYEAVRADGEFRLRAAIKIVKRGVDTDFVLKRFRNERQILAALDHPYITRLIDGGTTEDGRPYFVMEYVDGQPLYRHCDKNRLSVTERLELFTRICEAVEYAHQKRVIHRDLKPSNIYVTADGSPRLLDFGIAKLLDPDLASDTLQPTATALRMMTVDYASPEQVRGDKVTYETDVYSLGVILFELLTGHRPYRTRSRSPHDVARAICDEEPVLPSHAISGEDATPAVKVNPQAITLAGIIAFPSGPTSELREQLRGNIDNIVMKAMRKDLKDRYHSVAALREDIQRHISGEMVSGPHYFPARPATDALETPSGAKLLAVLPLSFIGPAITAELTDESYLTIGLADAIITRLTSVRQLMVRPTSSITRYNEHYINPFRAGLELGVDFVLDGRLRQFRDRIRISLQLLDVRKGTAIWAGHFDQSLKDVLELEDAISEQVADALIPQLTGAEREKLAKRGTNDPMAYEAFLRGRFYWNQFSSVSLPKALKEFETAVALDPDYALAHSSIADFYIWANIYGLVPVPESYVHAEAAARHALSIEPELGEAYASLGLLLLNQFKFAEAEAAHRKGIDLSPNYSLGHEWFSALLMSTGRFDDGVREMLKAEELDPLSLRTKTLVAWTFYQAGQLDAALAKAEEIIDLDGNYAQGHLQRGYVLSEMGRADEAVASLSRGMDLMPGSSMAQYMMCFALRAAGRLDEAQAIAYSTKVRSETDYIKPMFLGLAHLAAGKLDDGFAYLDVAVKECDPWLCWIGTDPKYKPFYDDPRFQSILARSHRRIFSNGARSDIRPLAMGDFSEAARARTTSPSELPTLAYEVSFFRRNYGKLAAVAAAVILLFVAFQTGLIRFGSVGGNAAGSTDVQPARSIAILPFVNSTGDISDDYIAEGLGDGLTARVGAYPAIRTISRAAAVTFKSKKLDPRDIGTELGVESVLIGTLTKQGDQYTLQTDLISVANNKTLFSMFFVEKADRILELQDQMATRIIEALRLQAPGKATPQKGYTANNDAFQTYLKAEYHRQKGTPADSNLAVQFYEQAIAIDPGYALAYQGMSLALRSAPAYGSLSPQEAYPKAKAAAEKALSIDPSLSSAYVSLAAIKATYDWDFAGAEEEYKRAIQLGPNNAEAHYSYANFLVAQDRSDEALAEFRYAQQLDPLSLNIRTNIGWALYISGRYDEALAEIREVIARDPSFARGYMNLGEVLEEQGKWEESIAAIQKAKELSNDPLTDMALGHVLAESGRKDEAKKIAADLEEKARDKRVSPFLPAVVYAGLGENDRAFYWLERAFQERSNWLTLIKVGHRLKPLRSDPRFDDLLNRIGFSKKI